MATTAERPGVPITVRTASERELFDRAAEAYRHQDLEAMRLVHDILYKSTKEIELALSFSMGEGKKATPEKVREMYLEKAQELTTDYTLAKALYSAFCPTEEDSVVLESIGDMSKKRRELMDEIDSIRAGFFNRDAFRKKSRMIKVLESGVAGLYYSVDLEYQEGRELLASLTPGTELTLLRDTDNEHDKWAISAFIPWIKRRSGR